MTKRLMIDPPSGWRYGFPKATPANWDEMDWPSKVDWFEKEGYPRKMIEDCPVCGHYYEGEEE